MSKKLFIETLGCAMNTRDSEHMIAELNKTEPYELTTDVKNADLILVNTCSVREKPVAKLFSELGVFRKHKKDDAKIGVCGCTASHLGKDIIKRAPFVDFVIGARNVSKITQAVVEPKSVYIDTEYDESEYAFGEYRSNPLKAYINISIGCDKQCTFCIVPHTRGEEVSIPANLIVSEVQKAVDTGAKEVFLLGQNVNNYGRRFSNSEDKVNFTKLLQMVTAVEGLERVRFTSPHPFHMDDEFLEEFAKNPKICKSMHMPLQSGSSKVLKDMKRGYTKEWFLNRAKKLREMAPDAHLSTDIIVAFPNETNEDFEETLDVMREVRFEQIFSFKYSPRPHTEAQHFEGTIDPEIASERLTKLQAFNDEILDEHAAKREGTVLRVMFDELRADGYIAGRANNNMMVKVKGSEELMGQIRDVKITQAGRGGNVGQLI